MAHAEIKTEGLNYSYRKVKALDQVDLEVKRGEIFALLGPSGAGKTTLLDILLGLLQAHSGRMEILGQTTPRLGPRELAQIGYVNEEQKWPRATTLERLIRQIAPLYPTWDDALCAELVRRFDLRSDRRLGGFSRGERMRVRLVLATAFRPRLLVLDEPFSGIDPMVREDVVDSVLELTSEERWSVLMATHEMATAERLADRIGFLDRGELWLVEELESLLRRCRHVRAELEEPLPTHFPWPDTWRRESVDGRRISFLDTAADLSIHPDEAYRELPGLLSTSVRQASLERIFISLHRHRRHHETRTAP